MPIAEVSVHQSRILEGLIEVIAINLRIDVPVDLHDVLPTIVIVIDKTAAPRKRTGY